jgi:hypothetical protein
MSTEDTIGFTVSAGNVSDLAYNPDDDTILTTDYNNQLIRELDASNGNQLNSFSSPQAEPYGIAYDRSTGNIITCRWNGGFFVHDGVSSTVLNTFSAPAIFPSSITIVY